jgi:hypothetical protein
MIAAESIITQGVVPAVKLGPGRRWALTVNAAVAERCQQWIAQSSHLPHLPARSRRSSADEIARH